MLLTFSAVDLVILSVLLLYLQLTPASTHIFTTFRNFALQQCSASTQPQHQPVGGILNNSNIDSVCDAVPRSLESYFIPSCQTPSAMFSIADVLPQFNSSVTDPPTPCHYLISEKSTLRNRTLCTHCLTQILNTSLIVNHNVELFVSVLNKIFFRGSESEEHKNRSVKCRDAYRSWVCTTEFNVYNKTRAINLSEDQLYTKVSPCPRWCEDVLTSCPYLIPSDENSNGGEPVFLCNESNYKEPSTPCDHGSCCCYDTVESPDGCTKRIASDCEKDKLNRQTSVLTTQSEFSSANLTSGPSLNVTSGSMAPSLSPSALSLALVFLHLVFS